MAGKPSAPAKEAPPPKPVPEEPPSLDASLQDFYASGTTGTITVPIRNLVVPRGRSRKFGEWDGRFFWVETVTWESNVFQTQKDTEDDLILLSTLGGAFARQGSDFAADVAAAGTWEAYQDHPSENIVDGWARAGFQYGMRRGFLRVSDMVTHKYDTAQFGTGTSAGYVFLGGEKVVQTTNQFKASAGYNWEKTGVEGSYANTYANYGRQLDELDGMMHTGTLVGKYRATPKTELNVQAEIRDFHFRERINNDFTTYSGYVGAKWTPTPKTELSGRAGWTHMNSHHTGTVTDDSEYSGFTGNLAARWAATAKVKVQADTSYDVHQAAGSNYQETYRFGAGATWAISPLWEASLRGEYQRTNPSTAGLLVTYETVARVGYRWKEWLEVALQYEFLARGSADPDGDYVDHRVSMQFSVLF